MTAQIRPSENGPEWWTLGMANASRIEEKKKCVTHWLKRWEPKQEGVDAFKNLIAAVKAHNEFYGNNIVNDSIDVKQLYIDQLRPIVTDLKSETITIGKACELINEVFINKTPQ